MAKQAKTPAKPAREAMSFDTFAESWAFIKAEIQAIDEDYSKLTEKGVKKSSRRVRKALSNIAKACKPARALALEAVKEEE